MVASRGRAFEMGGRPVAMGGRAVAMGGNPVVLRGRANLTCMILRSRTRGSPPRHRVEATAWRH
jgi:hypothetical protein